MWLRAIAVWLVLILAESVHGVLRGLFLAPLTGDFRARQIAVFTGALIIVGIVTAFIRWLRLETAGSRLAVGLGWAFLTFLFEVGLGRAVFHYPWQRIFEDFDPRRGGLLSLGFVVLALSPSIASRIRREAGTPPRGGFRSEGK